MKKLSLLVLGLAGTQLGATDCGQVLRDPGFDLWCGEDLCSWKVVRGEVRRAPTWHARDAGVELVGPDAAISQLAPVNSGDGACIRFELVANVDEEAEAYLAVDVYGDGSIERRERLPASRWKPLSYNLAIKAPFDGIRFELSKQGAGAAVLGRIHAETTNGEGCEGLPPIDGGPAPLGAACAEDAGCASGLCRLVPSPRSVFGAALVCVGCDPELGAAACGAGMACGVGEPRSPVRDVPIECVPEGGDELGELCLGDGECATGRCTGFVCSTCRDGCTSGEACGEAWERGPSVCAPGAGRRLAGEPCATDADCASSLCNGAVRRTCEDGRPCASPGDCPVQDGLAPGACTTVGKTGGTCQ
ncbi:MAG TPA: hypothetical protein VK932_23430 [Kofleriaceae bacterium]|nr:hypothetical protein [Kofleriaceae bacterium]